MEEYKYAISKRLEQETAKDCANCFKIWELVNKMHGTTAVPIEPKRILSFFCAVFFKPGN